MNCSGNLHVGHLVLIKAPLPRIPKHLVLPDDGEDLSLNRPEPLNIFIKVTPVHQAIEYFTELGNTSNIKYLMNTQNYMGAIYV